MADLFLKKLKCGDKASWAHFFCHYVDYLYKHGLCLTPEEDALKDCIQDVLLSLYERRESIDAIENMRAYLLKALKNKIISYQKSMSNLMVPIDENRIYATEVMTSQLEISEEKTVVKKNVSDMLRTLTKRERELLELRFYKGLSNEAISILCGIKKQTVSNAIHKALKTLKSRFKSFKGRC